MKEKTGHIIGHIIAGIILLAICYFSNYFYFSWDKKLELLPVFRLIQFLLVYNSIRHFSKSFKDWKHYQILFKIVEFPNMVYPIVVKPYLKMFIGLLFFLMVFLGGTYAIYKFVPELIGHDLSYETKAFLFITTSTILIRTFGDWLIRSLVKWNYKTDNLKEHIALTSFLVNEERIRYLIYIMFFISLLVFTFFSLENIKVFSHGNIGVAILGSFGTFIAYDRLFNSRHLIKFNPKKHWELLIKVYEKDSKYTGKENYLTKKTKEKAV